MKTTITMKSVSAALGVPVPRSGDISATIGGNIRVHVHCGATWQRRKPTHASMFPRGGCRVTLADATKAARCVAAYAGIPVSAWGNGRTCVRALPDGTVERPKCGPRGPYAKLP